MTQVTTSKVISKFHVFINEFIKKLTVACFATLTRVKENIQFTYFKSSNLKKLKIH